MFGLGIQQLINEQCYITVNFLVRLGIKQLHHNTMKSPAEKKKKKKEILQGCNSIKYAPSSCQVYKKKRQLDQVKLKRSSISTNSLPNGMFSTSICAQNSRSTLLYGQNVCKWRSGSTLNPAFMKSAPHFPQRIMSVLNVREPTGFPIIFRQ